MSELLKRLLARIGAYVFPSVGEADPEPAAEDAPEEADPALEAAGDDDSDVEEAEPEAKPDPIEARIAKAEREALEARERVEMLARQQPARPNPILDEEARKLADPNVSDLEKWQIQSNQALRASQQQSAQALFQAQDMADRTTYMSKAVSNPLYEKYEKRVEQELAKARSQGQNVQRELILQVLIGRDMLNGNIKPKANAAPKTVPRGKSPGARSDTPARGGMSEHQKRIARLENTQI